jgi:hypothetical protein
MMNLRLIVFSALALAACDPYDPTIRPDYSIRVKQTEKGNVAVPPTCADWKGPIADPFDNQPMPQFGCANARNLAMMSEEPKDLVEGRTLDRERAVHAIGAVRRYDSEQTRTLVWPAAETSSLTVAPSVSITGDATAAASSAGGQTKSP